MNEVAGQGVAGFVLAGGRSRRMGRDKAMLPYGRATLLERALDVLRATCDEVAIAGSRNDLTSFAPVVPDEFADCGPLGGIHAALKQSSHEWNIFLAVDLPRIESSHINTLLEHPRPHGTVAVAAEAHGRLQPLFGIYHRKLAGPFEQALLAGERAVILLLETITAPDGLLRVELPASALLNANTPEELTALGAASLK